MDDSEAVGDAIHPDTACLACGEQSSPETRLICDSCSQGFHLGCFGLTTIPEDEEWQCQGCGELQRLAMGQVVVLEMPQSLYAEGQDPHFTQGMFQGTIKALGEVLPGMLRKVQLVVEDAPLPGSLAFYSSSTHKRLKRFPSTTKELAQQLYQRTGSELCTVTVASGRFGMFGSCAAAANKATEAWLVGPTAEQRTLQALAGPAKQLYLLSSSGSKEGHRPVSTGAAEQDKQQQQQTVPMQTSPPPPPQQQLHSGQQQHIQHSAGLSTGSNIPPNQPVAPMAAAPAYMPWPQIGPDRRELWERCLLASVMGKGKAGGHSVRAL
uniref:PHD-type domain-containing protein n=1 Tax=Tetradesmus obliquus TaxID=3088 RepID=A0A383WGG2_TETOB|eukprot:jgi/Sobl393_1/1834/SZX76189.1